MHIHCMPLDRWESQSTSSGADLQLRWRAGWYLSLGTSQSAGRLSAACIPGIPCLGFRFVLKVYEEEQQECIPRATR